MSFNILKLFIFLHAFLLINNIILFQKIIFYYLQHIQLMVVSMFCISILFFFSTFFSNLLKIYIAIIYCLYSFSYLIIHIVTLFGYFEIFKQSKILTSNWYFPIFILFYICFYLRNFHIFHFIFIYSHTYFTNAFPNLKNIQSFKLYFLNIIAISFTYEHICIFMQIYMMIPF